MAAATTANSGAPGSPARARARSAQSSRTPARDSAPAARSPALSRCRSSRQVPPRRGRLVLAGAAQDRAGRGQRRRQGDHRQRHQGRADADAQHVREQRHARPEDLARLAGLSGAHPLIPEFAMPSTRNRWKARKNRTIGQQRDHRHGEHRAERGLAGRVHERPQRQRERELLRREEVDQLGEEVVPGPDEGEDRRGDERRTGERQDHAGRSSGTARTRRSAPPPPVRAAALA